MHLILSFLFAFSGFATELTGNWEGQARPLNDFLQHQPLAVSLAISPSGEVAGTVGKATLKRARFRARKKTEWKAMNHYEYRIDFQLEGDLLPGLHRRSGRILLNWRNQRWEGWILTEGSLFGGSERVQIQAVDLLLQRPSSPRIK